MESVVRASLPASSDFGGEMPLRKRRTGSPPSVLFFKGEFGLKIDKYKLSDISCVKYKKLEKKHEFGNENCLIRS